MSAINCLKPAELITLADDACADQAAGPGWLMRSFYQRSSFSADGRFRMMNIDKHAASVGLHVCHPCENAPGTDRREMRTIEEFTIPHLKYQDQINWCNEQPVKYLGTALPWDEMDAGQKWEQFDSEKIEDQLQGHFTTLNVHAANAMKYGAYTVRWANPDEAAEAAGDVNAGKKDIVFPRNSNHLVDLSKEKGFKVWGKGRDIEDIGVDNNKLADRVRFASGAAVTDVVMGPGTFTYGIKTATKAREHFTNNVNCCDLPADGSLSFTNRSEVDCEEVTFHGEWDGVRYFTYSGQYADRDGNLNYYIDPGHALFVANGRNGFQGIRVNGGINHPEVYKQNLEFFIKQYGGDSEGMQKGQSFWSRSIVYPGKPNATLYAKVLSDGLIAEITSTSGDLLADAA